MAAPKVRLTRSHQEQEAEQWAGRSGPSGAAPGPRDMWPCPGLRQEAASCQVRHGLPRLALGKVLWGEGGRHAQAGALENSQPRQLSPGTNPQADRWPPSHTATSREMSGAFTRPVPLRSLMGFYALPLSRSLTLRALPPGSPRSSLASPSPRRLGERMFQKEIVLEAIVQTQ